MSRRALIAGLAALAAAPARAARPLRVVALGDSLTAGYGLPQGQALPDALMVELKTRGLDVSIANAGVSGDTASGGLARLDWSGPEGTDAVILALGANDMLRGTDPAVTRAALETAIKRLKARGVGVMLAGMLAARNLGADYAARFDAIYPDLAKQEGLPLYPFLLDGVAGQERLNLPDRIHPTAEGVRVMAGRMAPSVAAFLQGVTPRG